LKTTRSDCRSVKLSGAISTVGSVIHVETCRVTVVLPAAIDARPRSGLDLASLDHDIVLAEM
jgi:hypothetical protein